MYLYAWPLMNCDGGGRVIIHLQEISSLLERSTRPDMYTCSYHLGNTSVAKSSDYAHSNLGTPRLTASSIVETIILPICASSPLLSARSFNVGM